MNRALCLFSVFAILSVMSIGGDSLFAATAPTVAPTVTPAVSPSGLSWNSPGVNPVQVIGSRGWVDANTGAPIQGPPVGNALNPTSVYGNPATYNFTAAQRASLTTAGYRQNAAGNWMSPGTSRFAASADVYNAAGVGTASNGVYSTNNIPSQVPPATAGPAAPVATPAAAPAGNRFVNRLRTAGQNFKNLSTKAKVFRGAAVLGGALMVFDSTRGKPSWGNVLQGAIGGATAGASVGGIWGAVGGVVIGGVSGGAGLFSRSGGDCLEDPLLGGVDTCCNTVFYTGSRWVGPGGIMFCDSNDKPMVRQCLNGGSTETDSAFKGDEWSECKELDNMWCSGVKKPDSDDGVVYIPSIDVKAIVGSGKIQKPEQSMSEEDMKKAKICWAWNCDTDEGWVIDGNKCVQGAAPDTTITTGMTIADRILQLQVEQQQIIQECGSPQ